MVWQHSGPTGDVKIPEPIQGCDEGYDMAKELVSQLQQDFTTILYRYRDQFGYKGCKEIRFVNSKYRYEIEIPADVFKKIK